MTSAVGHVRVGRLPHSRKWRDVVSAIDTAPSDVATVAAAVIEASEARLRRVGNDPSVAYCFWVLLRLAGASGDRALANEAKALGVPIYEGASVVGFLGALSRRVSEHLEGSAEPGHFREMAAQALRRSLVETVGEQGHSLFGASIDEIEQGFRRYAGAEQFGRVTTRFFGEFLSRILRSAVDRELSEHVGAGRSIRNAEGSAEFTIALERYARESARIVQEFSRDWYAKKQWHSTADVTRDDAGAFVSVALNKLRRELKAAGAGA